MCTDEEWKFGQYALKVINEHDPTDPLFLCYCFHIVHEPLHVPREYFDRQGALLEYPDYQLHRTIYHAMVKVRQLSVAMQARTRFLPCLTLDRLSSWTTLLAT